MKSQVSNCKFISLSFCLIPCLLILALSGCTQYIDYLPIQGTATSPDPDKTLQNLIKFTVSLPDNIENQGDIFIDVLDEVTGLSINPTRYRMSFETNGIYSAQVSFLKGSVVKYRYVLNQDQSYHPEYDPIGMPVRYRLLYVTNDLTVNDLVYAFDNNQSGFCKSFGRIQGKVINAASNTGVPDVLITAGGLQTYSATDGSYTLDCIKPGKHNLVAMHINGSFQPFQQEAIVAENSLTPAVIKISPRPLVDITFITKLPDNQSDILNNANIRFIGNIYNLGNTFANLNGGFSTLASKAPLLKQTSQDTYSITIQLPAGLDLRYKYTLGDGYINSERNEEGGYFIRQIIIPNESTVIQDSISNWGDGVNNITTLLLDAPDNTPALEVISIQINPSIWTNPIPMRNIGNNQWEFHYIHSLHSPEEITYRYCRNDQCEFPFVDEKEMSISSFTFKQDEEYQKINDSMDSWPGIETNNEPPTVVMTDINYRRPFIAGIRLSENYSPTWMPYYGQAISNIKDIGANIVILSPSWTFQNSDIPILKPTGDKSMFFQDVEIINNTAADLKLEIAMFPKVTYDIPMRDWWYNSNAIRDEIWWQLFFDRYQSFIIHNANLAHQINASAIIIEDPIPDDLYMSVLNPIYTEFINSQVIQDYMQTLIVEIRKNYTGAIIWAIDYDDLLSGNLPMFLDMVDQVYVEISTPWGFTEDSCDAVSLGDILDNKVKEIFEYFNKPITIAMSYPSIADAGCAFINENSFSQDLYIHEIEMSKYNNYQIDLLAQADFYNELFIAVNDRDWISGVVSDSYYPPISLMDKTASVHGKPAADVLWFWFTNMLEDSGQ